MLHPLPLRRHQEHHEAHVNARLPARRGQRLGGHLRTGAAGVPAVGFTREGDGLGGPCEGTTPAHRQPTELGEDQEAILQRGAVADLFVGEGVGARAALETGKARGLPRGHAAEERLVGPVQAGEHVLQDVRMDGGVLRERRPEVRQLRCLLRMGGRTALPPAPPRAALLQRAVVELAAQAQRLRQHSRLLGRWLQFVCVRLASSRRRWRWRWRWRWRCPGLLRCVHMFYSRAGTRWQGRQAIHPSL